MGEEGGTLCSQLLHRLRQRRVRGEVSVLWGIAARELNWGRKNLLRKDKRGVIDKTKVCRLREEIHGVYTFDCSSPYPFGGGAGPYSEGGVCLRER
jgi:hypothetical protein